MHFNDLFLFFVYYTHTLIRAINLTLTHGLKSLLNFENVCVAVKLRFELQLIDG